jgi:2-amino-4-hydroxy-6-hydroxymethyldihydropteridine diphosphokinase
MPEPLTSTLHPILITAAQGRFPDWTVAKGSRLKHMGRVAKLLRSWGKKRGDPPEEILRWAAAGYLHDTFRDADPQELRELVEPPFRDLPPQVLHGPMAALRLREEGVADEGLLNAITYHTLGSPDFEPVGMALYAADFLEPGRNFLNGWRKELRRRFPTDPGGVLKEILKVRLNFRMEEGRALRMETVAFWNRMAEGDGWVNASEG